MLPFLPGTFWLFCPCAAYDSRICPKVTPCKHSNITGPIPPSPQDISAQVDSLHSLTHALTQVVKHSEKNHTPNTRPIISLYTNLALLVFCFCCLLNSNSESGAGSQSSCWPNSSSQNMTQQPYSFFSVPVTLKLLPESLRRVIKAVCYSPPTVSNLDSLWWSLTICVLKNLPNF